MDDVKDKVKGLFNKVNNPFSPKFKGQGRVLGSTSSTPSSNPSIPALQSPAPRPRPQSRDLSNDSTPTSVNHSLSEPIECPVCRKAFALEEEVAVHLDSCLEKGAVKDPVSVYLSGCPSDVSVEVMVKLLGNVVKEPGNSKFRRLRMGNSKIKDAVGDVEGAVGVLQSVGFVIAEEEGDVWATMEEPSDEGLVKISEAVASLERRKVGAEVGGGERGDGATQKIDRKVRVFFPLPGSNVEQIKLPDSFYNLSALELKREVESKKKKMADSQLLIPKSYKEKQMKASRKKYTSTVIRVQFPDGVVIQGIFLPWELTSALYEFASSALKEPALEFDLLLPAMNKARVIPNSSGKALTLEEEELVPSALVKFRPKESELIPFTGIRNDLLEASEPLTASSYNGLP